MVNVGSTRGIIGVYSTQRLYTVSKTRNTRTIAKSYKEIIYKVPATISSQDNYQSNTADLICHLCISSRRCAAHSWSYGGVLHELKWHTAIYELSISKSHRYLDFTVTESKVRVLLSSTSQIPAIHGLQIVHVWLFFPQDLLKIEPRGA